MISADGAGCVDYMNPVAENLTGWPLDDAIKVAVETLRNTPTKVEEARIVAFGRSTYVKLSEIAS